MISLITKMAHTDTLRFLLFSVCLDLCLCAHHCIRLLYLLFCELWFTHAYKCIFKRLSLLCQSSIDLIRILINSVAQTIFSLLIWVVSSTRKYLKRSHLMSVSCSFLSFEYETNTYTLLLSHEYVRFVVDFYYQFISICLDLNWYCRRCFWCCFAWISSSKYN